MRCHTITYVAIQKTPLSALLMLRCPCMVASVHMPVTMVSWWLALTSPSIVSAGRQWPPTHLLQTLILPCAASILCHLIPPSKPHKQASRDVLHLIVSAMISQSRGSEDKRCPTFKLLQMWQMPSQSTMRPIPSRSLVPAGGCR